MLNHIDNYRKRKSVHYSLLSSIDNEPREVFIPELAQKKRDKMNNSDAVKFGSLVDFILLTPNENINDYYYIFSSENLPSDAVRIIIDNTWRNVKLMSKDSSENTSSNLSTYSEELLIYADKYQSRWKPETKLANLLKEGSDYFNFLYHAEGKIPISANKYNFALKLVEKLRTHPHSTRYFTPRNGIELYYQYPIFWKYRNILPSKALVDIIQVDHNRKEITPVDLKVTGKKLKEFDKDLWTFRYDIEAAWYFKGVTAEFNHWVKQGYTINNFEFLIIGSADITNNIIRYPMSDQELLVGEFGGRVDGKKHKGFIELISDFQYYKKSKNFLYPREISNRNGIMVGNTNVIPNN